MNKRKIGIALAVALMGSGTPAKAGKLFTLDARINRAAIRTFDRFADLQGNKVVVPKAFLGKEYLFYFAVTATSDSSIDMGIMSEMVVAKLVQEGDTVKVVRARPEGNSPAGELVASFKAVDTGDQIELDLTTDMALRLEGGVYKAEIPDKTQDLDLRTDRLAYTQLFTLKNPEAAEGAPKEVTLGLRFFILDRSNPGFTAKTYPTADRKKIGYFTHGLFTQGPFAPPNAEDFAMRWDLRKTITYTLHPNVPQRFREKVTTGLLSWNPVFKKTLGIEPIKVEQSEDPNLVPGDPDKTVIYWFASDVPKMYLGQAHPIADPRTGEIFSAYMLLSQSEFEGAVGMSLLGLKIDSIDKPNHKPIPATLVLGAGRALRIVTQRENMIDRARDLVTADLPSPEAMLDRIVSWTVPHEAGHSLGLRHNFKSTTDLANLAPGEHSCTVMEYMPPTEAPSVPQGYDHKAIAYGYDGQTPSQFNKSYAYGTDEDKLTDPDVNTYDVGEPMSYLANHWRNIRRARPQMEELADPRLYMGLLGSAVDPLPKFLGVPQDPRHGKAVDFFTSHLADQGIVTATAGGNEGATEMTPNADLMYTKNLFERIALMRAFWDISEPLQARLDKVAMQKIVDTVKETLVDAKKTDLFMARAVSIRTLASLGEPGWRALAAGAQDIVTYAKANPTAPTFKQEVFLLGKIKELFDQLQARATAARGADARGVATE